MVMVMVMVMDMLMVIVMVTVAVMVTVRIRAGGSTWFGVSTSVSCTMDVLTHTLRVPEFGLVSGSRSG